MIYMYSIGFEHIKENITLKTTKKKIDKKHLSKNNLIKKIGTVKNGFWLNNLLLKLQSYLDGEGDIHIFLRNQEFLKEQMNISFTNIFKVDKYQIEIDKKTRVNFYYIKRHHVQDLLYLDPIFDSSSWGGIQIDQIEFIEMLLTNDDIDYPLRQSHGIPIKEVLTQHLLLIKLSYPAFEINKTIYIPILYYTVLIRRILFYFFQCSNLEIKLFFDFLDDRSIEIYPTQKSLGKLEIILRILFYAFDQLCFIVNTTKMTYLNPVSNRYNERPPYLEYGSLIYWDQKMRNRNEDRNDIRNEDKNDSGHCPMCRFYPYRSWGYEFIDKNIDNHYSGDVFDFFKKIPHGHFLENGKNTFPSIYSLFK